MKKTLKKILINGLVAAGILAFLAGIIRVIFKTIYPLRIVSFWIFGKTIPGFEILVALILILALGTIVHLISKKSAAKKIDSNIVDKVIARIKELKNTGTNFINAKSVLVKVGDDIYLSGFTADIVSKIVSEMVGKELIIVFLPNTPVPWTGWTIFTSREKLIYLPGSRTVNLQEIITIVISGGLAVFKEEKE